MSIQRPAATITLGGVGRSLPEAAVASLRVELALGSAHDRASLSLWGDSDFAGAAPGDALQIALGFGDDVQDVFTGVIDAVDAVPGGVVLEALASTCELSRTRVAQAYLAQSIADVVRDLVSQAGGQAGTIDAPTQLAAYHVDDRRTVWSHLLDLARLAGCDLRADASGAVCFAPPRRGAVDKQLRHGAELLAWRVGARRPAPDPIAVLPYGAASENGSDAWHHVLRTPDGSSPSAPSAVLPSVRDRDLAQSAQTARANARDRTGAGGEVAIVGDPALRPGALVQLTDLPGGDPGDLRVLAVTHLLDAHAGFLTALTTEAAS